MKAEKVDISSLLTTEALSLYDNHIATLLHQFNVPTGKDKDGNTTYSRDIAPAVYLGVKVPAKDIVEGQPADQYKQELADIFNKLVEDGIVIGGVVAPPCIIYCQDELVPEGLAKEVPDFGALVLYTFSKKTMLEINTYLVDNGIISQEKKVAFHEGDKPE